MKMDISVTEYQKWFHSPSDQGIDLSFTYDLMKISWHNKYLESSEPTKVVNLPDGSTEITFELDMQASVLLHTTLSMVTPEIFSMDPNLLVAWPDNLFHNHVKSCTLKFGDTILTSMDSKFFDASIQLIPKVPTNRFQYLRSIGNVSQLNQFSTKLPPTRISFPVPWGWSQEHPLPIMLMTTEKLTMTYVLEPLENLIRVLYRSGFRKYKPTDPITVGSITIPKMTSAYAIITPSETIIQRQYDRYLILDHIESFDSGIVSCKYPCRAFFIMAENTKAAKVGNLSVYGTNPEDGYSGSGPLISINGIDAEVFSNDEPYWTHTSPERPGYYLVSVSPNLKRYEDVGTSQESFEFKVAPGEYNISIRAYGYRIWLLRDGRPSDIKV